MFTKYIKSGIQNISRNRGYSFINIMGLAIGIASSLAISLWVIDELSYNNFHSNSNSIYKCYRRAIWNNDVRLSSYMSAPVGPALKETIPGISEFVRYRYEYLNLQNEDKSFAEWGIYVDPSFLKVFSFPLVEGNQETVLSSPNSIVISEKMAGLLFGDQNPIGKTLAEDLVVTGIAQDVPKNSSIQFEYLIPISYAKQKNIIDFDDWWSFGFLSYFQLEDGANAEDVGALIKDAFKKIEPDATLELHLQPLDEVYLHGLSGTGRITYVYIFSLVALLLIIIACINFMNLATARSAKRAKEIGLRKTVGAGRLQLVFQILIEASIQAIIAVAIAVAIVELSLPLLTEFFGRELSLEFSVNMIFTFIALIVAITLAAGSYPAFILSSFRPASVLMSNSRGGGNGGMKLLRKVLVVFQFVVSTSLIFMAIVIYSQLDFFKNKDLGYEKENIISIRTDNLGDDSSIFKEKLLQHPGVLELSAVSDPPVRCNSHYVGYDYEGKPDDYDVRAGVFWVDYDYVDMFGLEIIKGRNFSREYSTDESNAYLINEAAAIAMKMDDPVGKSIGIDSGNGQIVGVVKNYNYSSLHSEIEPLLITIDKKEFVHLCIMISPEDIGGTLGFIEEEWKKLRPGGLFNYEYIGDLLGAEYRREDRISGIVLAFTIITAFVAGLGLFGLAAYSAERRTKEIGIRKVLGITEPKIIWLLIKEFIVLVIIGNMIAAPVASYIAGNWLDNFAYRIDLGWGLFALTSIAAFLIALATVSFQALRAARANPVKSLKYE